MPGLGLTREEIPSNVQSITAKEIRDSNSLSLTDLMNSQMQSVTVNDYQGNPFQVDVQFRIAVLRKKSRSILARLQSRPNGLPLHLPSSQRTPQSFCRFAVQKTSRPGPRRALLELLPSTSSA